jgi:hypothetical protein
MEIGSYDLIKVYHLYDLAKGREGTKLDYSCQLRAGFDGPVEVLNIDKAFAPWRNTMPIRPMTVV